MHSAAVDVDGRHAYETGDLASIQAAELRQFRQEGVACNFANATNRLEKLILHTPCFVSLDRGSELRVDFGDLLVEDVDDVVPAREDEKHGHSSCHDAQHPLPTAAGPWSISMASAPSSRAWKRPWT